MATNKEISVMSKLDDARALEDAARVVRRRLKNPAGVSCALFCRTLTNEASVLRAEARALSLPLVEVEK